MARRPSCHRQCCLISTAGCRDRPDGLSHILGRIISILLPHDDIGRLHAAFDDQGRSCDADCQGCSLVKLSACFLDGLQGDFLAKLYLRIGRMRPSCELCPCAQTIFHGSQFLPLRLRAFSGIRTQGSPIEFPVRSGIISADPKICLRMEMAYRFR